MKKKMIIYMSKLSVGGMEKALLNLIEYSNFAKQYDVEIYVLYSLEEKYLNKLREKVKVKLLWKNKWSILGKLVCIVKILFDLIKIKLTKVKYDVAICYPYQHKILSILTRNTSDNNIIFIHTNLEKKYGKNVQKHNQKIKFDKFKKVVCVSNDALKSFKKLYPNYKGKSIVINNYIDGEDILKKSKEVFPDITKYDGIKFINIARHDEDSKRISRIINSSKKLKDEGYKFKVTLIGSGNDTPYYQNLVKKLSLEEDIIFLGKKINPYPYLKNSDCLLFSSLYEGYGIVLDEARILNIPFVTTDVADAKEITKKGYGILCENSEEGIYLGMKKFLEEGYQIKNSFNYKEFNEDITKSLDVIVK